SGSLEGSQRLSPCFSWALSCCVLQWLPFSFSPDHPFLPVRSPSSLDCSRTLPPSRRCRDTRCDLRSSPIITALSLRQPEGSSSPGRPGSQKISRSYSSSCGHL